MRVLTVEQFKLCVEYLTPFRRETGMVCGECGLRTLMHLTDRTQAPGQRILCGRSYEQVSKRGTNFYEWMHAHELLESICPECENKARAMVCVDGHFRLEERS